MTGKWVGAFAVVAFIASVGYFANSSLMAQQHPQAFTAGAAIAQTAPAPNAADLQCPQVSATACYFTDQSASKCDDPAHSQCYVPGIKAAGAPLQVSETASAALALSCVAPQVEKKNLSLTVCQGADTTGTVVKGHCVYYHVCIAEEYLGQDGTWQKIGNTQVACSTPGGCPVSGSGNAVSGALPGQNLPPGTGEDAALPPAAKPVQYVPGGSANLQPGSGGYLSGANSQQSGSNLSGSANQGVLAIGQAGTAPVAANPVAQQTPVFQQNPALTQTLQPLAPNGTVALANQPPTTPTTPTTFTNPTYAYSSSPVTAATSKLSPSAVFGGIVSFIGGLFSSLSTPTQTNVVYAGPSAGSTAAPGSSSGGVTNPSNPNNYVVLVYQSPSSNVAANSNLLAQENLQKLLNLAQPGPVQGTGTSLSALFAVPAPTDLPNPASISGASDLLSAYTIGAAAPAGEQGAGQGIQPAEIPNFSGFMDLGWATPTAVTIGVPVSLSAAPPASSVFDQFNAGWTQSQTLLQEQTTLAQVQSDYAATQAQIAAWQQLQDVGLCDITCLSSLASLESQGWQQQAQANALTTAIQNGGSAPQTSPTAPTSGFGSAGQSTPTGGALPPVQNAGSTVPGIPAGTVPVPAAIAQYAAQPAPGSAGFEGSTTRAVPIQNSTASSGGLLGLPAVLATIWQTISNWLQPVAPAAPNASSTAPVAAPVQNCSLFSSLFGGCTGS